MENYKKNWFKYITLFVACFLIRLIPFRSPNIEPILTTQMPFAKRHGKLAGFSFGFLSIILYDLSVGQVGVWTFVTSITYGLIGIWAGFYFRNRNGSKSDYVKFAVISTLLFDIVTGLSIGPIFYGQSFVEAVVGQIPFTALHLLGNISFAYLLSPVIYNFVTSNKKSEIPFLFKILNYKHI